VNDRFHELRVPLRGGEMGLNVRMKKTVSAVSIAAVLALVLALAFAFAGCGGSGEAPEKELDMDRLAEALVDGVAFDDQMEAASSDAFYALYAIDPSEAAVASFVLYASTGATAEEAAVIEARDAESAPAVMEFARGRIASQKAEFENYAPEEMAKLNDPVLVLSGKYVILCLSNDNAAAEKIIGDFID
jgi:hypothetical protein